eukprot:GHVU01195790.1.p2 GENE.GHVU01195790.1~~GHVU01195790.1.p2  ORF type:complete len:110 (-),score=36.28 GHVU01195790.1:194-523(-)
MHQSKGKNVDTEANDRGNDKKKKKKKKEKKKKERKEEERASGQWKEHRRDAVALRLIVLPRLLQHVRLLLLAIDATAAAAADSVDAAVSIHRCCYGYGQQHYYCWWVAT